MVTRFEWERAVRRLNLRPPARKLVALLLATYGNKDGSNIHPGEDRLAAESGMQQRAVRGHLKALRDVGLIVRTYKGSSGGRKQVADEYELALPADVVERVGLAPMPDHRQPRAGDRDGITGSPVPVMDGGSPASPCPTTGIPTSDHRHDGAKSTGTHVPPTSTGTKDVDQEHIPSARHVAASRQGHPRASEQRSFVHRFTPADADGGTAPDECVYCPLPRNHPNHITKEQIA